MHQQYSVARLLTSVAVAALLAAGLGGCQTMSDVTGSISSKAETRPDADPRRSVDADGERYRANPKDADAALRYGQALRATGQRTQAVAVLEQATLAHPSNKALLAGYGRALADNGNFQQSFGRIIPTGVSCRCREPRSISSAGMMKPGAITTAL